MYCSDEYKFFVRSTFFVLIPVIHSRHRRRQTSQVQSHAQERVLRDLRGTFRFAVYLSTSNDKDTGDNEKGRFHVSNRKDANLIITRIVYRIDPNNIPDIEELKLMIEKETR